MSPEQARGEDTDARTDLFSFGAVLYEMATGRMAFSGNTTAVIFDAILHHAPTPPLHLNPESPPKLEEIINKAFEKDRDLRYQNASDIRADLKRLKRDTDSGRSARCRHPRSWVTRGLRTTGARSSSKWGVRTVRLATALEAVPADPPEGNSLRRERARGAPSRWVSGKLGATRARNPTA